MDQNNNLIRLDPRDAGEQEDLLYRAYPLLVSMPPSDRSQCNESQDTPRYPVLQEQTETNNLLRWPFFLRADLSTQTTLSLDKKKHF